MLARIGRRGFALLFFALLDAVYAYGLLDPDQPIASTYAWAAFVMPLWAWAACWGAVAAVCLVSAFFEQDTGAFVAVVALKIGWGLLLFFGWALGSVDRGYVSAAIWLAFGAFVYLIAGGIPAAAPRRVRP